MRRAVVLAVAVLAVLPAAARAVTIQQFPLPTGDAPAFLKVGTDGNLWIVDQGANPALVRVSNASRATRVAFTVRRR